MWVFLGLTVLATVYLGWHYFADALGGAVLGTAGVWIAALGDRQPRAAATAAARTTSRCRAGSWTGRLAAPPVASGLRASAVRSRSAYSRSSPSA